MSSAMGDLFHNSTYFYIEIYDSFTRLLKGKSKTKTSLRVSWGKILPKMPQRAERSCCQGEWLHLEPWALVVEGKNRCKLSLDLHVFT